MKKLLLIMFAVMAFTAQTSAQSVDIPSIGFCGNTLYISNGTKSAQALLWRFLLIGSDKLQRGCIQMHSKKI